MPTKWRNCYFSSALRRFGKKEAMFFIDIWMEEPLLSLTIKAEFWRDLLSEKSFGKLNLALMNITGTSNNYRKLGNSDPLNLPCS